MSLFYRNGDSIQFDLTNLDDNLLYALTAFIEQNGGVVKNDDRTFVKFTSRNTYDEENYQRAKVYDFRYIVDCVKAKDFVDSNDYRLNSKHPGDEAFLHHFFHNKCADTNHVKCTKDIGVVTTNVSAQSSREVPQNWESESSLDDVIWESSPELKHGETKAIDAVPKINVNSMNSDSDVSIESNDDVDQDRTNKSVERRTSRKPFMPEERRAMLRFLIENKKIKYAKGLAPWKEMIAAGILTHRTPLSLLNHFNKFILPNIELSKLPKEIIQLFQQLRVGFK